MTEKMWEELKKPLTGKRLNALTDLVTDKEHSPKIYRLAILWAKANAFEITTKEFFHQFFEAFKVECRAAWNDHSDKKKAELRSKLKVQKGEK